MAQGAYRRCGCGCGPWLWLWWLWLRPLSWQRPVVIAVVVRLVVVIEVDRPISKMCNLFPGFQWFPLVFGFPETWSLETLKPTI